MGGPKGPSGATVRVPEYVQRAVARAAGTVTEGLPRETWNGLTPDTYAVGEKGGGTRHVHLLPPGVHPASADEAKRRFAWNAEREALWHALEKAAPELRSRYGVRHVIAGGSYFSTDYPHPSDIDLVAVTDEAQSTLNWMALRGRGAQPYEPFNRSQGEHGVHVYAHDASIFFGGGPSSLYGFRFAPANPRPPKPSLGGPSGPEVGLVLLDLTELEPT